MFKMTDALDEIISMSNDDDIKSKAVERSGKKNKGKDGKGKGKHGKSKYDDDDSDEDDIDDGDDEDDYDELFKKQKSGAIDIVGSAKKKRKKVNKKQLGKDLQNNKIRQIKVSMPYSVNADNSTRVIDYNNSRHAGVDGSVDGLHPGGMSGTNGVGGMGGMGGMSGASVPFYKQSWFKTLCTILITIACSLIMCVVVMQAYKHIVYRIRTNPLADDKKKEEDKMSLTEVLNSQKEAKEDSDEEFDKLAESEDEKSGREKDGKDKNKVKGGMIGGSKRNNIKGGSKSLPQRDSRGRFMKRS